MADFDDYPLDQLVPLSTLSNYLPKRNGVPVHRATIFRWATVGSRGARLRVANVGHIRYSCRRWLIEFLEATSQPRPRRPTTSTNRQKRLETANAELDKLGV